MTICSLLYHNVLINLGDRLAGPETVLADPRSVEPLLADSKRSYETLLRLYYLRHGFESADVYLAHGLNFLAKMAMARMKSAANPTDQELDEARSTLLLAAKGLNEQGKNYHLTYVVFRFLVKGMDPADVNIMQTFLSLRGDDGETNQLRMKPVYVQYPANDVRLGDNPDSQRICNLKTNLEDLSIG
jgi:hypothetical protein